MQSPLLRSAQETNTAPTHPQNKSNDSPLRLRDQSAGSSNQDRLVMVTEPSLDEEEAYEAEAELICEEAQGYIETPRVSNTEEAYEDDGVNDLQMETDDRA